MERDLIDIQVNMLISSNTQKRVLLLFLRVDYFKTTGVASRFRLPFLRRVVLLCIVHVFNLCRD